MKLATLFNVWFGELPYWLPQYLDRACWQFDVVFITDQEDAGGTHSKSFGSSLEWVRFGGIEHFKEYINGTIGGCNVQKSTPYSLCDLRPALGMAFSELVGGRYWAWSDIDVVFGDVIRFVDKPFADGADIISSHDAHLNGPFTMLRNRREVIEAFMAAPDWREVFADPSYQKWDENGFGKLAGDIGLKVHCSLFEACGRNEERVRQHGSKGLKVIPGNQPIGLWHFSKCGPSLKPGIWPPNIGATNGSKQ